ncbi:MAG TPA: nitrogen regulation protein NR(I) [Burkholderiaceae bacterium]|nr:nitrogen regulation protein NR(I) [Burkholderiaceae bacterium]
MKPVWIVDDDQSIRWVLEKALERAGLSARSFSGGAEMLEALQESQPAVLVTDVRMPGMDGLSLLHKVKEEFPDLPVIVMTAFTDLSSTVEAFQKGAFDYLPKPFDINAALGLIQRAAQRDAVEPDSGRDKELGQERVMMQSSAPAMQEVFRAIGRLAASNVTVLVTGESGSGKELIARALHEHGRRAGMPFVALNAAAIPKDLLEAELFGHERGAFTGATQQRRGRFEEARGGTLFLDEIGDMPFDLQTRLLRVLAEGSFYRVGGSQAIRADVRIIAATHQPLEQRVLEGRFREDLFHRLNVIRLRLPPLRERKEDIPELARLFLRNSARDLNVPERQLTPEALDALMAFDYPGNIRQLENFCQWLTVMSSSRMVEVKDLPPEVLGLAGEAVGAESVVAPGGAPSPSAAVGEPAAAIDPSEQWRSNLRNDVLQRLRSNEPAIMATLTRQFEEILITTALSHCRGRRVEAALRLGIGRNTLTRKCNELGIGEERE